MSKTTQFFSMKAHFTSYNVRDHDHIGMPITTYTYSDSIAVSVSSVINQFILVTN